MQPPYTENDETIFDEFLDKPRKKDKNEYKDAKRINQERKAQREFKRGWK